jgi:hypothetical protein
MQDKEVSMVTFAVIFRGRGVNDAEAIAVSSDKSVVARVARAMLDAKESEHDPILDARRDGEQKVLRLVV